jgi:hypothetical protein
VLNRLQEPEIRQPTDPRIAEALARLQFRTGSIEYTDRTHVNEGQWRKLIEVHQDTFHQGATEESMAGSFFSVEFATGDSASTGNAANATEEAKRVKRQRVLDDAITQSLVRVGILGPHVEAHSIREILHLLNREAVVLVPDTNALSTGTLHWLLKVFREMQVWIMPVVISLTQVQQRHTILRGKDSGQAKDGSAGTAIRSRTLVNAALGLLERCCDRYQVLEVDPQLLRYVKPPSSKASDPDLGDVLEDRLFLEAIHEVFRATRSRTEKRVVTSDVLLARILHAEGIPTLFLQVPPKQTRDVACVHYDPLAKAFLGASLASLMWDLTHSFSDVRLCNESGEQIVRLQCYWPGKTAQDWIQERLLVTIPELNGEDTSSIMVSNSTPRTISGELTESVLPGVSLMQVLRLGGLLLNGAGTLEELQIRAGLESRPESNSLRFAAEILRRAGLARFKNDRIVATQALSSLDSALAEGLLADASKLLEGFLPYKILIEILQENETVGKESIQDLLANPLGATPAKKASNRLLRFPVYFGQAWTDGNVVRDGTATPSKEEIATALSTIFDEIQIDGLASIEELLPLLCRSLRTSPWFAAGRIEQLVQANRFPHLSFDSAAGERVQARDQVVSGNLTSVQAISVPQDRIFLGERPVFTVSRRPQ